MMGYGFGLGGVGLILMLVFWLVVIGLAVWFLSILFPRASYALKKTKGDRSETSLEILNKRFARGEISKAEYDEIRDALSASER